MTHKNHLVRIENFEVPSDVIDAAFFAAKHGEEMVYEGTDYVIEVERSAECEWSTAIDHLIDGSDFIYEK